MRSFWPSSVRDCLLPTGSACDVYTLCRFSKAYYAILLFQTSMLAMLNHINSLDRCY